MSTTYTLAIHHDLTYYKSISTLFDPIGSFFVERFNYLTYLYTHVNSQMKQKLPMREKPHTKRILEIILQKTAEEGATFVDAMNLWLKYPHAMPSVARRLQDTEAYWERQRALRAIRDLERKKFITTRKTGRRLFLALTQEGRASLLTTQIRQAPRCSGKECVVVIFDIPESERHARLLFRRFLQECEFQKVQRSVWMCHRAVLPHLRQFIKKNKIEPWVCAFVGHDITF